jgi:CRP-like cAMP-binding protein
MDASQLKSIPLFDGVGDDVLARWAGCFQETELLTGAGLAREGDFAYKFFVVLDGEVEVLRDFEHVAKLGPGEFFGEMGLVNHEPRNARIVAETRCRVAWMMGWDFESLTKESPELAAKIQRVVDERRASIDDR